MVGRRDVVAGMAVFGLGGPAVAQGPAGAVTVDAPCGPVRGQRLGGDGAVFLGVPYAAPPLGQLRFASPQPHPRWTEPLAATGGSASVQTLGGAAAWLYEGGWPMGEDCLGLNVWSPDVTGRRPVMVWLHGGAWRTGMGNAAGTTGLALMRAGVVLVTVNYRLGALGWLAHPALADGATGAAANWGLQDQVAALRWVKANIAAFGGDPDNVTLFGQSAGGSSTMSVAQDSRNAGLLHKAIIQSGSLHGAPGFAEMDTAAAYAATLARRLDTDVPGLRRVPAPTLHGAELQLARDPAMVRNLGRPPVLPVLDGVVLRGWPRDGAMLPIPLLIGTTRSEAVFWYDLVDPDGRPVPGLKPPATRDELVGYVRDLVAIYRPEAAASPPERLAAAYLDATRTAADGSVLPAWLDLYTDIVFRLRARTAAARQAGTGQATFLYEFDRPIAAPAHGVPHTAEIPFVFGTWDHPFFAAKTGPDAAPLSAALTAAWAEFARTGRPGPAWVPADADTPVVNVLGGPNGLVVADAGRRTEELKAWDPS